MHRQYLRFGCVQCSSRWQRRPLILRLGEATERAGVKQHGYFERDARKQAVRPIDFGSGQSVSLTAPIDHRLPDSRHDQLREI